MFPTYTFDRGETASIMIEAVGATPADIAQVTSVSAVLKFADGGIAVPPRDSPVVAVFSVVPHAGDQAQGVGPGWTLTLSAAVTETLDPETYITTPVLTLAGGAVQKHEPALIRIVEATS